MNTKTNLQHASNLYNGDTVGRDSPSALLDMLAEVASQTLHSEKKRINSLLASNVNHECQCKPKTTSMKRKESHFTVPQLLSMPVSHLVKQFTIFTSDELKRLYSYTCALVPGCQQKYTSFASEVKARTSIKNHLEEHLEYFKRDKEAYDTFTARGINHKNLKTNLQNKKSRIQQTKKPQETLNKENKDVILEKSTNYLRKILLHDINIKEIEKQKCFQKPENKEMHNSDLKNSEQMDYKVLGDHSYFERLDDKISSRKGMSSLNNVLENTAREENIVLMVVGTDSVHMEEYSHVNQKLSENAKCQDESRIKNIEASTTTKPKGKAKFIGTSKEEREMALAYMERIKKKGNPTGSNLQCRICDPPRTFTAPTTLVSHYRSHAGIKPYECRICRAVFTRRHSLKYHMLIHQNQTRFTCTDCGKKFRHPSHFKEHQRRHTGEAPFGCDDCGQRFKTRNTYKRHLKTRHGKILTTTGELLHLPDEDFQKIRTNRRRKDCVPETTTNINNVPSAIVNFNNQHNEAQIVEEYVLKENIDDINRNWGTKKTANNEENHVAYQHNYEDRDKVYDCNEVIQSYTEANCNNEVSGREEDENITQQVVETESSKEQVSYHNIIYDNDTQEESTTYIHLKIDKATNVNKNDQMDNENFNTRVIIAQNETVNERSDKYANCFNIENKECVKNEIYLQPAHIANANVSILQTVNTVEEIAPQNQNMILQQDEHVSEFESVATKTLNIEELNVSSKSFVAVKEETRKRENNQYLYLHAGTLDDIVAQNKCINIPLHQINLYRDQHNQFKGKIDNCKQIKVLNGDIRAINIEQSDKQNAILLVSNDSLQNGILQIDKGNITVKGTDR
ncbi:uncharacterized protein LOC105192174 isoform X2 [Harpegnathos saltator]|uniref:uncharacterized protein LOC105192174 isoform X2 n=1 Tax=Harpegnathos saltator TaxID=610380 RepID=UPI0005910FDC|nr:uncharacterized protein LOC105192174 isoform X2 [Harpegnathos saltator]